MAKRRKKGPNGPNMRTGQPVTDSPPAPPLEQLAGIAQERVELERRQVAAVLDARLDGATWTEIGRSLGVSPQAVQKRYGGRV